MKYFPDIGALLGRKQIKETVAANPPSFQLELMRAQQHINAEIHQKMQQELQRQMAGTPPAALGADVLRQALQEFDRSVAAALIAHGQLATHIPMIAHSPVVTNVPHAPYMQFPPTQAPTQFVVPPGIVPEPFLAEPELPYELRVGGILAFRAWRCADVCGTPQLASMMIDCVWPGPVLTAHTRPPDRTGHGIYAAKSFKPLDYPDAAVYGEVLLYGRVVEHEAGYRAEKCRIARLVVVDHQLLLRMPRLPERLERRYGCAVSTDIRDLLTPERDP